MDFTHFVFIGYGILILLVGFLGGMEFEYQRIIRRVEEVTEEVKPCCGNCMEYNGSYCTKYWNNLDECYMDKDRDSREPEDSACDDWEFNPESLEEE